MSWDTRLTIGQDNAVEIDGLYDTVGRVFLNSETGLTGSLYTEAGVLVSGSAFSFSYVAGTNGRYIGTIPAAVVLTENATYEIRIGGTVLGGTITVNKRIDAIAEYDGATV